MYNNVHTNDPVHDSDIDSRGRARRVWAIVDKLIRLFFILEYYQNSW